MDEKKEIKWTAPEFPFYEKGPAWYLGLFIITTIIILVALWERNFLFAVFAVVASILGVVWGKHDPRHLEFKLSEEELQIQGKKRIPLGSMAGFSIIDFDADENELIIRTKNLTDPQISIQIEKNISDDIKSLLVASKVPEMEYNETLSDRFLKILRF